MGPNGFFYGEPVVVCENPEFHKVSGGTDNVVARVTSHELGHVLFLQHRQERTNLMASGKNGVSLNEQEIKDARRPVSYTHLDVYKRQLLPWTEGLGYGTKITLEVPAEQMIIEA